MNDQSRTQGSLICIGAVVVGALFLLGLARESYWALAVPVGLFVAFVLGLVFWVGWTIATIRVEPEPAPELPSDTPAGPPGAGGASEGSASA